MTHVVSAMAWAGNDRVFLCAPTGKILSLPCHRSMNMMILHWSHFLALHWST